MKLLKRITSSILAVSVLLSSAVILRVSAEDDDRKLYENNCYVVNTNFYDNAGNEIFSYVPTDSRYITNKQISQTEASFTVNNVNGDGLADISAYVAQYNADKALIKVTGGKLEASAVDTTNHPVSVPFEKSADASQTKLFVWDGVRPISETAPEDSYITVKANVENDTAAAGTVSISAFAVMEDGTEKEIAKSAATSFASLENKDINVRVNSTPDLLKAKTLAVKIDTGDATAYTAAKMYLNVQSPVASRANLSDTMFGAHDPSIVKFPNDDTYYVYSSHHLIFTSKDLIDWKKYDFANIDAGNMSPKTKSFISSNYSGTTMNGTYWAPDVIYKEGDEHPYWMYISLSCGLGGRNSAIALIKSDSPLFWADSKAQIIDDGVVLATKHNDSYKTNAIDAHIYTDTDGAQYFIWGSFWGGIQAAKLMENGRVEGVDYTSDATILSSCQNFGTSVFTQGGKGAAGPEGAWMINHGDYRYMFTSYGWLGSNYNTRMARAPLSKKFSEDMGTQLVDAKNTVMGNEINVGGIKKDQITGYKLIGSYRLGDGAVSMTKDENNEYYYQYSNDSAHIYYGSGHNSAIETDKGSFYVSHVRKDYIEGAAWLQVRKMLYTKDGWPVVSPVTYAGEVEQALPKEMIYGTYDFASVGYTKMDGSQIFTGTNPNRNYDLPVISSKVTLNENGTMANGLGTWTFDGDHTVTLKFTKNGDESKDEFYKSGDVVTMYALFGYDKDEEEHVIALTGTDQNHITQFAKKSMKTPEYKTPVDLNVKTEPTEIARSAGGNPELGFDASGNILYGGDPAATVIGDTVYLVVGHDTASDESYVMPDWVMYTSKDMTNWEYKGPIMSAKDISWRSNDTSAWASQMTEYKGKYYLYYCTWDKTSSGKQSIGVAVAKSPTGPYVDKGSPIVKGTFTTPETSGWNDIDPTVLIDTDENGDEHRYLAWGNGKYYICELNEDMISVKDIDGDGEIVMHKDIKERQIKSMNGGVFTEAPWLYKRGGKYYLFYAMNWREEMAYAMMDDPMGRYDFKQIIMPPTATSNTNHPSVIDFNGKTYFIYHNGALPHGSGFRRSVCIQELEFDENGYVIPLTETSIGLTGTASTIKTSDNKYIGHEAFVNSLFDDAYPISANVTAYNAENGYNTAWEIVKPKTVPSGQNEKNYVSIQSVNKPGLYIASTGTGVTLTQDADGEQGSRMTFKTVKGLDKNADTISFESVSDEGKFLTVTSSGVTLSYGTVPSACSFKIGTATEKDINTVNIAEIEVEQEPDPEPDITENFNLLSTGTLISLTASTAPYTSISGLTLYMGSRDNDHQPGQNFAIQTGGVSGNALVLNTGKYQSASRGPRMQIHAPAIPNGYTVTAQMQVKQGTASSILRYNDSTSDETGTEIAGLTTSWQTLTITITKEDDLCTRVITLGDTKIAEDYVDVFPVFWGTTENGKGQSIYFDDLSIRTTDKDGNTPVITMPDPAHEYAFDDNLTDSVTNETGMLTGSLVTQASNANAPVYTEGKTGKAVSFTGAGSYGVELPAVPSGSKYTISFDVKLNAATQYTPFVFMANYDGNNLKGGDDNAQWISIAPQGWKGALSEGPMIWSRNVPTGSAWNDLVPDVSNALTLSAWHNVTVSASGAEAVIYVDAKRVGSGPIANIIDNTTRLFVGVNAWDTPLNGAIDNLKVYDKALSASQVAAIIQ